MGGRARSECDGRADGGTERAERLRPLSPGERQPDRRGEDQVEDLSADALDCAGGDDLALALQLKGVSAAKVVVTLP
jgi:hypothetical protein